MKKPKLSPRFDENDIHKLRVYNSERRKSMTQEEWLKELNETADKVQKEIEEIRKRKMVAER